MAELKFWIPYFDNGRKVLCVEVGKEHVRLVRNRGIGSTRFTLIYHGGLYNGDHCYRTEEGAWAYWDRKDDVAFQAQIEPEEIIAALEKE